MIISCSNGSPLMFPLQETMRVREGSGKCKPGTCLLSGKIPYAPYQSCLFHQKQSYRDSAKTEK